MAHFFSHFNQSAGKRPTWPDTATIRNNAKTRSAVARGLHGQKQKKPDADLRHTSPYK
jgi:hypothetical protein